MKLSAIGMLAAFVAVPQLAMAFIDPPWITPELPRANEPVSVSMHLGVCDAIFDTSGYPQITRDGTSIRLLLAGAHYEQGSELCIFGIGTVTYDLGTYAASDYTLRVDLDYDHVPFGPDTMTIGVVPFTVSGGVVAEVVPSYSPWSVLVLLIGLAATAAHRPQSTSRSG